MTRLVDIGVFAAGLLALVVGVGIKDWAAALIVLGSVLMGIVITARFMGANKE